MTLICAYCGKEFEKKRGRVPRCCSKKCNDLWNYYRPDKLKRFPKVCENCNKEFKTNDENAKYCSRKCRGLSQQTLKNKINICPQCNKEFTPTHKDQIYCSIKCVGLSQRKIYLGKSAKFYRDKKYHIKRREQIKDAFVEDVSYDDIYIRYGGICQICGMVVYHKSAIDIWGGTVDHIIPLSKGGTHEISNCQLAHMICNTLKKDKDNTYKIDWNEKIKEDTKWAEKFEKYYELSKTYKINKYMGVI